VRANTAETYMLNQDEELCEKDLPSAVEALLAQGKVSSFGNSATFTDIIIKSRDRTMVVSFRVPHNAAVQIYDYNVDVQLQDG